MKIREVLNHIKSIVGDKEIILFGSGLSKILLNKKIHTLDIFIKFNKEKEDVNAVTAFLPYISTIRYHFEKSFNDVEKSSISINDVYLNVNEIENDFEDIRKYIKYGSKNFIKDINKKVINYTKEAKENFKPEYIFEAIYESIETDFLLSSKTMDTILKNKSIIKNFYKRQIYSQLLLALGCSKTQKFLEMMNIFGLSKELFDRNIENNLSYQLLEKSDVPEFLFCLFNFSNIEDYKHFLIEKCGVLDKELNDCLNVYQAFNAINPLNNPLNESEKIYHILNGNRILNFCRLLNMYKMQHISKILKKIYFKNMSDKNKKLVLRPSHIKVYFGIDNKKDIDIILNEAKKKIEEDPSYNNIDVLLSFLKERIHICQSQ